MTNRKAQATEAEAGTGNVYADLDYSDADEMLVKTQLVTKIADIIERKGLTQTQAAELLGMPQPKLSKTCCAACSAVFPSGARWTA